MAQRVVRRKAEAATAPAAEHVPAGEISLVLSERRQLHTTAAGASRPDYHDDRMAAASRSLTTLRALAERCAVSVTEGRLCEPTNLARNYYDGGRDFDISHSLTLAFASAGAAARFLADAELPLTRWLACRRARSATLHVDDAELILAGERALELACARVERIADAQRSAPRRRPAVL